MTPLEVIATKFGVSMGFRPGSESLPSLAVAGAWAEAFSMLNPALVVAISAESPFIISWSFGVV